MRTYVIYLLLIIGISACSQPDKASDKSNSKDAQKQVEESTSQVEITEEKGDPKEAPESDGELTPEMENAEAPEEFYDMDWAEYQESFMRDFSFVIIISTKSYDAALKRAKEASEKLGYPLDLRGLHANKEIGLSFSREVCEDEICGGGLNYPIYIPRSDWGEDKYISIEYSDAFARFTKGYYIVVVASGEKGAPVVKEALTEAKKHYKDAYAKTCSVYMGCGC